MKTTATNDIGVNKLETSKTSESAFLIGHRKQEVVVMHLSEFATSTTTKQDQRCSRKRKFRFHNINVIFRDGCVNLSD